MSHSLFYIDTRVYVAGILIPVNSVTISSSYSNIPRCSISMPPHYSLYGIGRRDRIPVQVFIGNSLQKATKGGGNAFTGDPENDFILIFDGEISGFGYMSSDNGKEFVINCVHHSVVFNDIKVEFLLNKDSYSTPFINGQGLASLFKKELKEVFPLSLMMNGLSTSGGMIKHPTDLLRNVVNFIINKEGSLNKQMSVLGDFYSKLFELLKMDKRFSDVSIFDEDYSDGKNCFPLLSGLSSSFAMKVVSSHMSQLMAPNFGTLFDILTFILEKMEYEFAMYTSPAVKNGNINFMCVKPMLYDAIPPKCNIIFKSHVQSIQSSEQVHGVPTRIRVKDIIEIPGISGKTDFASANLRLSYYPTETYQSASDIISAFEGKKNMFTSELLKGESHTGPFLYDCMAPLWTTYINAKDFIDSETTELDYKNRIMKSQLQMKILESRNFNIRTAFNPYIVQGAPAVVYDSEDSGFIFVGYVLAVEHTISKRNIGTQLTLGLVRDVRDELDTSTRLYNTLATISTKFTHREEEMNKVYGSIFNSDSVDYPDIYSDGDPGKAAYLMHDAQYDPLEAYDVNWRPICTFKNYADFMGIKYGDQKIKNSSGDTMYSVLSGSSYLTNRYNGDLRDKILKLIAQDGFDSHIYSLQ